MALVQRLLRQLMFLYVVDVGQRRRATHRISAERGQVISGLEAVCNFCARREAAEWKAVGNSLRRGQNIGLDAVVLDAKHSAGTTKSRLHFIGDEEDSVTIKDLLHA